MRSRVDLPVPLAPISASDWPDGTVRSSPEMTLRAPKLLVSPEMATTGACAPAIGVETGGVRAITR